jgi:hypothetical protein
VIDVGVVKKGVAAMKSNRIGIFVALILISGFACQAQSATPDITQAVSTDCRWDYHNFCSEYGIGSPLLNYCFRNNGAKLSKACVNALIAAGDVSKAYVQARRRAGR